MKELLKEELERMLYLNQHKRGVVVSEQNIFQRMFGKKRQPSVKGLADKNKRKTTDDSVPNARGKSEGLAKLNSPKIYLATNVGYKGDTFYLNFIRTMSKSLGYVLPGTPGTPDTPIPAIPGLYQADKELPYPDNFIRPQWSLFQKSKENFDKWITFVSDLIKKTGGLKDGKITLFEGRSDNNKPIEIYGTANAAAPNTDVPTEMRNLGFTKIDHNYGGETTDKAKMNNYLAENRAKEYGKEIAKALSEKTGISESEFLKYMSYGWYSYYGSGQFGNKSISLNVKGFIPGKGSVIPGTQGTNDSFVPAKERDIKIDFSEWGGGVVDGRTILDDKNHEFLAIPKSTFEDLKSKKIVTEYEGKGTFNGKTEVNFKIVDDVIYLDEVKFGKLYPANSSEFKNTPIFTDPFAKYGSYPGLYTGLPSFKVKDDYVVLYPLYLTLTQTEGRDLRN